MCNCIFNRKSVFNIGELNILKVTWPFNETLLATDSQSYGKQSFISGVYICHPPRISNRGYTINRR